MSKSTFVASTVFLVIAIGSQTTFAAEMSPEERAIRKEAKDFADAYNQGKADDVAAQWTKDGEYTIGQQTVKGRGAIAKLYGEFIRANPGSKMEVKVTSVRLIAPTVAIEEGTASVSNSASGPASASSYSAVHVKQGDKWPMVSVRESEIPAIQIDRDLNELDWMVGKWSAGKDSATATMECDWMTNKRFLRLKVAMNSKNGDLPGGTQIIGRNPTNGQIVSWFFNADGGYGTGVWQKNGTHWMIRTVGITADGTSTRATNVIYLADKNVASWQSFNRYRGDMALPDVKEVVIERLQSKN
jgi:uncharacterized protein (TIGR02246 family)